MTINFVHWGKRANLYTKPPPNVRLNINRVIKRLLWDFRCSECSGLSRLYDKKAVLSQRWPRNAPYRPTWVPWKFSGIPDLYAHGYYSQHFSWAFVRIDCMNVPKKFEVRSFACSRDSRGTPQNWAVSGYAHAPFSPKFLMGFYSDWPYKCIRQIWSP